MTYDDGFVPLFNGSDLTGWVATPRTYGRLWPDGPTILEVYPDAFADDYEEQALRHPAAWTVEDGVIVGRADTPGSGYGGYLVSEGTYGDYELIVEAKPDWPADTGIMLRKNRTTFHGIQVLVDHRQSGTIGGFYGNGIGGFHAVSYATDARMDDTGNPTGLMCDDPATSIEPFTPGKRDLLTYGASVDEFLAAWRWDDWNEFRIRIVGAQPVVTCWINGVKTGEIDMATMVFPQYDADAVAELLGRRGHIAFEVHDDDVRNPGFRWGRDAACRWRNVRIKEL